MPKQRETSDGVMSAVVSTTELATLTALTPRRIQMLAEEGKIVRVSAGRFKLADVLPAMVRMAKEDARKTTASTKQGRLTEAKAREVELRIAEKQRDLVTLNEAIDAIDAVCGAFRTELSGLAARMHRTPDERSRLEAELDGILNRIADRFEQEGAALRTGGGDAAAVAQGGAGSVGEDE